MIGPEELGATVVYLSGPMTGLPDYNFPNFNRFAYSLRGRGFVVINPAETAGGVDHLDREWYFRMDLSAIAESEAVFVMPGWKDSEGAKTEVAVAHAFGLPVYALACYGRVSFRIHVEDVSITYKAAHLAGRLIYAERPELTPTDNHAGPFSNG